LSEKLRKKFEDDLKQAEEFNRKITEQTETKLVDVYIHEYGPLSAPDRSYVLLGGIFRPPAGQEESENGYAKIPVIQFFFK